ncbi:hypothetical protein [Streptomyces sp. UNOC14_S4]|uniref:hypothetical protein n=1 Tax=Streptomyces sp. UNOC14_S4 TaxID=2872340 RepID=UPI001E2F7AFD|nr:hypothetical protein [Streptomyces sp. UNOC14_S4]MCC3768092.1 hypothetical protein [Streptomyces sp. UNOC14_S4]
MHRTAPRLARILACAAVPVMLVATGCSGDDNGSKKSSSSSAPSHSAASPGASAPAKAATLAKLPEVCKAVDEKTIDKVVPKAAKKEGETLPATSPMDSASCFWAGLDKDDPKNLQYRSLTLSLKRFSADPTLGSGEKLAANYLNQRVTKAVTEDNAKEGAKPEKIGDIGNEAQGVSTDYRKAATEGGGEDDYRNAFVVTRVDNVVITVKYTGAGYEGAKNPDAGDLMKNAQDIAKEAVTSVQNANKK